MPHYKIYDNELGQERLVAADSKAIARSFVADPVIERRFKIDVAKTADVARLMGSGIKLELASKTPSPDQAPLELPPQKGEPLEDDDLPWPATPIAEAAGKTDE